jgi:hypothetical protein
MDAMSIDMNIAGNTSSVLSTTETCARLNENNIQDADESSVDSLTFDTTAAGVPAYDDNGTPGKPSDDFGGILVYGHYVHYPAGTIITNHSIADAGINLLYRNPGSLLFDFGDGTPDNDGEFQGVVQEQGSGPVESGSGVLSRITIESSPSAPSGMHPLTLTDNVHLDVALLSYFPDVTNHANIAINVACAVDTDGDGMPDNQDPDDDNDGVSDVAEPPCGGDPLDVAPPLSRPERIDGPFAAVDDDGDTLIDEALPTGTANFDCDGDGYKGSAEDHVFSYLPGPPLSGDQKVCQEPDTTFPNGAAHIKPSKRWPSDIAAVGGFSANKINVQDLSSFTAPVRYLNQNVGTDPSDIRFDLVPGSTFGAHINVADLAAITSGVTGTPPMLGGLRAFGGPVCPWAP